MNTQDRLVGRAQDEGPFHHIESCCSPSQVARGGNYRVFNMAKGVIYRFGVSWPDEIDLVMLWHTT